MKKAILLLSAFVAILAGTAFDIMSDNGKAGYTGSPSELTCIDCHSTYNTSNSGSGSGTIYVTSSMNNWQYTPGQTYTVNVIVKQTAKPLFGFGFEALTASNTNAGTIQVTNSVKTRLATKTVSGVTRNNIVHQLNGGLHTDSAVFTFNWVAPATNVGNVTFYFSGVAANNNGNENNDYVYNSSKLVTPASATGIAEVKKSNSLKMHVNAEGKIVVSYSSTTVAQPRVDIYDLKGVMVSSHTLDEVGSGDVELELDRPYGAGEGVYLVSLMSGNNVYSGKIYLQ